MVYSDPPESTMTSRMKVFSSILGASNYSLPEIQRDYSWKSDKAEELLEDLIRFHESGNPWYFLGPIVELDENDYDTHPVNAIPRKLIDGQQRFSTLTVLFCAMRDFIDWKHHQRKQKLQQQMEELQQVADQQGEDAEQLEALEDGGQQEEDEEEPILVPFVGEQQFIPPEITVNNTDFEYRKTAHHTRRRIEQLSRHIDSTIIVKIDGDEPVVRLELKNNDAIRLKFLQNPVHGGLEYNQGLNRSRRMPPGKIVPEDPEPVEHSRSRIYDNYDLFLNEINRKFNDFGTTVQYQTDDGDGNWIPYTKQLPGQKEEKVTGIMHTEEQLAQAFLWLDNFFVTCMSKTSMAKMTVTDWPTAYEVFVSTNSKGQSLTLTDIVRAMILSKLQIEGGADDVEKASTNLNRIANEIPKSEHDGFMRCHWISRNAQKESKSQIAKIMSTQIKKSDVDGLIRLTEQISDDVDHYVAVTNPAEDTEFGLRRSKFNRCSVKQHIPIMMAAERNQNYGDGDLEIIHRLAESLFVAHNVTRGGSPSKYETLFAEACSGVNDGDAADEIVSQIAKQAREDIFSTYSRQTFESDFSKIKGQSTAVNQFILRTIQTHLWHQANPQGGEAMVHYLIAPNVEVNIEHILPKTIRGNTPANLYWQERFGEHDGNKHKSNLEKIGNLTLLDKMVNQRYIINRDFPYKLANGLRPREEDEGTDDEGRGKIWSMLQITNQLAEYEHWTPESIKHRGEWLAGLAGEIWAETLGLVEEAEEQPENNYDEEAGPAGEEE